MRRMLLLCLLVCCCRLTAQTIYSQKQLEEDLKTFRYLLTHPNPVRIWGWWDLVTIPGLMSLTRPSPRWNSLLQKWLKPVFTY